MTTADAKEYLKGYQSGIVLAQADKVAQVGLDVAYASVWGAHEWKIKRALKAGSMVASQAYVDLPPDFENIISFRILQANDPKILNIKEESVFDYDYPYPGADSTDMPYSGKVVLRTGVIWALYFYPIPGAAYAYEMSYNKKADSAQLPNLPSYMLSAVLEKGKALMQGTPDKTYAQTQVATAELQQAMMSDRVAGGYAPMLGSDPGFDDFSVTSGGGSVWNPHTQ